MTREEKEAEVDRLFKKAADKAHDYDIDFAFAIENGENTMKTRFGCTESFLRSFIRNLRGRYPKIFTFNIASLN